MEESTTESINQIRQFNRFYTKKIGLLGKGFLKSKYSLTQSRVLYELAQNESMMLSDLTQELDIDPGYLSRILSNFAKDDLLNKYRSTKDNRQRILELTDKGKAIFSELDAVSREGVKKLLSPLHEKEQTQLVQAMETIESLLTTGKPPNPSYLLRSHRPGDMGWVIQSHARLYSEEYQFDESFEALVAEIATNFLKQHNPQKEHLWIAEQAGQPIGSIMVVDKGNQVAKLRLLLVTPEARGLGVGKRLVEECLHFAKRAGYQKIQLWTENILVEARQLYQKAGFQLIEEEAALQFGRHLISETWERPL